MTDTNATALFDIFVQAKEALEQLPKARADLDAAHGLLNEANTQVNHLYDEVFTRDAKIAELEARLSQTEAALADATKSANAASSLIDGLRGLLGVAEPVRAEPEVSTEPSATMGQSDSGESAPSTSPEPSANTAEPGSDAHTAAVASSEVAANTSATMTDTQPTEVANAATQPFPQPDGGHVSGLPTTADAAIPTASGPSASVDTEHGPDTSRRPASEKPYWVSWADWRDLHNGMVPGYVTDLATV